MGNIIRGREGKRETGIYREKTDNWGLEREGKERDRIKRALTKAGVNTCFKSGTKLANILRNKNKTKIDPENKKGIYRYVCKKCNKVYIGQMARCCKTRWREHGCAIEKGQWSHSGISQHAMNLLTNPTSRSSRLWLAKTKRN